MKKLGLLIMCAMLIASLAGPVMANPCTVQISAQPITIIPDGSTKAKATITITDITGQLVAPYERMILVNTTSGNTKARIYGNGVDIETSEAHTQVFGTYSYDGTATPTFTLEVWGTEPCTVRVEDYATIDPNDKPGSFDLGVATRDVNIPEFPTIALPVAAILGLVFIFGRKKEEL